MKKIYFEPEMLIKMVNLDTFMQVPSLDHTDPTNGLGDGTEPSNGGSDEGGEGDIWGDAKGRGMWDNDGLW